MRMSRIALRCCASLILALSLPSISPQRALAQETAATCAPTVGRLVSVQGNVDVQRAGTNDWLRIKRLDTVVCTGDRVRTAPLSRAALFVQPETILRVDQNTTIALSQTTAEVVVEFFQDDVIRAARDSQSCGAGYFITRFPKKLRVTTPHMNAAVEGTEFEVDVRCASTELAVIEGAVRSQNLATSEEFLVNGGQMVVAGPSSGVVTTLVKPTDAVQWVLYYPPLAETKDEFELPTAEQCRNLASPADGGCLTQRAETLLGLGRSDEALQDVDEALKRDPGNGEANALRAVVQVARNDNAAALQAANAATSSAPNSYRAWLAQSYAQQAGFDLDSALASVTKAQSLEPNNPLLNARAAELLLSLGRTGEAETAARAVVQGNPDESRGHTMLGFIHLAQIDTKAARNEFETAVAQDSFDALPRLGLGLAKIRGGDLVAGREQLEIAAALDPSNSLLRSYVGKAYYEENSKERDALAAEQFGLAKQLDPNDPTPWFYDAILNGSQNKPVEALQALQTSIERNGNRAVYRSRLLLDDDAAARSATVAAVYGNLGFEKLAVIESTKALAANAGNYSAHRQLASAYANLPRHDIARVSEALQAQIRQLVSVAAVEPLLSSDNLAIIRDTGPSRLATNEYNVLFNRNQIRWQIDALAGDRDTFGDQVVVSDLIDDFSIALGQLHYETDGFVENDAAEKNIYDLFLHAQVTPKLSLQMDAKRTDFSVGQTFFAFDPTVATPTTIEEESKSFRFSGHYMLDSGDDWIWSVIAEDREGEVLSFPDGGLFTDSEVKPFAVELQRLINVGTTQVVAGAGYTDENDRSPLEQVDIRSESANVYAYAQWRPSRYELSIQAGLAGEWFELDSTAVDTRIDRNELSPKFGLVWSPRAGTTVRAAAFSSVRRTFVLSQTIEPTQVAGFNQFFTGFEEFYGDVKGTISERVGVALDQAFSASTFAGAEVSSRHLDVPSLNLDRDSTWREKAGHVYFYTAWAPTRGQSLFGGWRAAISVDGEYEKVERPPVLPGSEGILDLETLRAPLGIQFFTGVGVTLRVATTYVKQEGVFSADVTLPIVEKEDDAWITDFSLEYRLPRRLGVIAVGVRNAFDDSVDLLEIDPFNPLVATRRLAFGNVRLEF
jgi:Tfp pilus assembly protein PilF